MKQLYCVVALVVLLFNGLAAAQMYLLSSLPLISFHSLITIIISTFDCRERTTGTTVVVPALNDMFGINFNWWVRGDVYNSIPFIIINIITILLLVQRFFPFFKTFIIFF